MSGDTIEYHATILPIFSSFLIFYVYFAYLKVLHKVFQNVKSNSILGSDGQIVLRTV